MEMDGGKKYTPHDLQWAWQSQNRRTKKIYMKKHEIIWKKRSLLLFFCRFDSGQRPNSYTWRGIEKASIVLFPCDMHLNGNVFSFHFIIFSDLFVVIFCGFQIELYHLYYEIAFNLKFNSKWKKRTRAHSTKTQREKKHWMSEHHLNGVYLCYFRLSVDRPMTGAWVIHDAFLMDPESLYHPLNHRC